jgi:protocatechuate 3,4-dioxygenase beta subunit
VSDERRRSALADDLRAMTGLLSRRELLGWMAGASLVPLLGCSSDDAAVIDGGTASCAPIPEETAGPFPGDGSIGPTNALGLSGIVRSDIRSSIAGATGTAEGVPLTLRLVVKSATGACAALAGYAVYVWHCDRDGAYSLYTLLTQNYLRGVQETGVDGSVTFATIFPGCYPGRWPHIHFEVYPSLAKATAAANKVTTSQLALPEDVCQAAYGVPGYAVSASNLTSISLATDGVFSDGASLQTASVTGNVGDGYVATLDVAI